MTNKEAMNIPMGGCEAYQEDIVCPACCSPEVEPWQDGHGKYHCKECGELWNE